MEQDESLKELAVAIRKSMGDKIGFSVFFTIDDAGKITHGSPMFRDARTIEQIIKTMKEAARALNYMADDMYNKVSDRKN